MGESLASLFGITTPKYQFENQYAADFTPVKQKPQSNNDVNLDSNLMEWKEADLLAEWLGIESQIAGNIITLLEEDNTIPFIAR